MKIKYHGHSCVELTIGGKILIIDPFITGNPLATVKPEEIKVDYILLTHGHGDHVGDTIQIAKQNSATVIAVHELATYISWEGVNVHGMNLGGGFNFDFGRVQFFHAFHSSSAENEDDKTFTYLGMPAGIIIKGEGKTIYHAGDTGLFSDMKMVGEFHQPDLAFLPIGDNYTMGPEDAVIAAQWVKAKKVVPIHYNTFPVIEQDPQAFIDALKPFDIKGIHLAPGKSLEL